MFDRNLRLLGGIRYTAEEQAFAETLTKTFQAEEGLKVGSQEKILDLAHDVSMASSDVGDVSWIVPTGQFTTATYVPGTAGHSWQSTACSGMSIGQKGMTLAAKVLTMTALDLFADPKQIQAARADFDQKRAGHEYKSRLPADQKPPLNYRDNRSSP
jgi:aminobenzoyl-glutamate utilization protein B